MSFSPHIWRQLKSISCDELIAALEKDNWTCDEKHGAVHVYLSADKSKRVTVHYHPQKTYGPSLLKALLVDIGWSEQDMRRVKLVK
mgnify:CR=1 FL=1